MKLFLGALALAAAMPVAAQAAPHAGHAQHGEHRGQPAATGHDGQAPATEHSGHTMDCPKDCCDKMKQQGQATAKPGESAAETPADHAQHGH